ncbi:hypothetical protein SAM19_01789 [Brevibacillus laterosporus]|nr:hypothetical protein [Brevibacillus laterosporus]
MIPKNGHTGYDGYGIMIKFENIYVTEEGDASEESTSNLQSDLGA